MNKLAILLLLLTPIVFASHMGPSRRQRRQSTSKKMWKEQEEVINGRLESTEFKLNQELKELNEQRRIRTLVHTVGIPKHSRNDKRVGLYGQMDLIREE